MAKGEITVNVTGLDEYKEVLKYAEEAGAACEEMKHGIERALEHMRIYMGTFTMDIDRDKDIKQGVSASIEIVKNNLSEYLDKED